MDVVSRSQQLLFGECSVIITRCIKHTAGFDYNEPHFPFSSFLINQNIPWHIAGERPEVKREEVRLFLHDNLREHILVQVISSEI